MAEILPYGSDIDNAFITPTANIGRVNLKTFLSAPSFVNGGTIQGFTMIGNTSIPAGFTSGSGTLEALGSTAATAALITARITNVNSVSAGGAGVILPNSTQWAGSGETALIMNNSGTVFTVYAAGGDTIDSTAGTTGITLGIGHRCFFSAIVAGGINTGPEGGVLS